MTNLEKYNQVFMEHFEISAEELPGLKYRSYAKWDSMAHMELCSILEETFDIALIFSLFRLMKREWRL